jgi:hypothetical protein
MNTFSDLCELRVSAVRKIRNYQRGGAEDTERRVLVEKFSDLCELRVSAVKT